MDLERPSACPGAAAYGLPVQSGDVFVLEVDRAGGRIVETQDHTADCALAATSFADQAECLATAENEGDPVDRW